MYRKATHTDRYLHAVESYSEAKPSSTETLVDRAHRIYEPRFLDTELRHLKEAMQSNSYSVAEVNRAACRRRSGGSDESVLQEFWTRRLALYPKFDGTHWEAVVTSLGLLFSRLGESSSFSDQ